MKPPPSTTISSASPLGRSSRACPRRRAWSGSGSTRISPGRGATSPNRLVGEVQIGDFTEAFHDCHLHERGLLIPVARTVRIGDGEVVGVGTTELFATGTDPSDIVTRTWGQNPSAELSGRYQEAHDAWWAQAQQRLKALDDPEGWEIDTISLGVGGRWDALKVGIVGQYVNVASGAGYGQSLWSGDATWPDDEY